MNFGFALPFVALLVIFFTSMPSQSQDSEPPSTVAPSVTPLPPSPVSTQLVVVVEGLRNDSGRVLAALYRGSEGFPNNDEKSVARNNFPIEKGIATFTFDKLPTGEYALSLFHDENDNSKLDTGAFGIPKEGFGFSNDPKIRFSSPKFSEAMFKIEPNETEHKIVVHMKYLTGKGASR